MFYEGCNQPVTNSVSGGFKENLSPPIYDEPEDDVQEEGHPNFLYEDCSQHVENSVGDVFKGDFSMPIYDECEDGYWDNAP